MADKGLEILSTLLQTIGGASQGVDQNSDGSKNYRLMPMLSGVASTASSLQDQKLAREAQKFQLEEAKRESQRRQEEWDLKKQDRERELAQNNFARTEQLKRYDEEKLQKQLELNKAALAEEGRTGIVQPRANLLEDAYVPVKDPKTGQVTLQKSKSQEIADQTKQQALNRETLPQTDLQLEGKIKQPIDELPDVIKKTALAGPIGLANGFFLSKMSENKQYKETKKIAVDPVTGKPNFYSANSKELVIMSQLAQQEGNPLSQYKAEILDAIKGVSQKEVQQLTEMSEITSGLKQLGAIKDDAEQQAFMDQYQVYLDRGKDPVSPKELYTNILSSLKQQTGGDGPQMALIAKAGMMTVLQTLNGELAKFNQERAPKTSVMDSPYMAPVQTSMFKKQDALDKARAKTKKKLGSAANQPIGLK